MTDEQIFKLAINCGLDEFVNEPLLKFARAMYEKGREGGYNDGVDMMMELRLMKTKLGEH
jgi:hypothetical protein